MQKDRKTERLPDLKTSQLRVRTPLLSLLKDAVLPPRARMWGGKLEPGGAAVEPRDQTFWRHDSLRELWRISFGLRLGRCTAEEGGGGGREGKLADEETSVIVSVGAAEWSLQKLMLLLSPSVFSLSVFSTSLCWWLVLQQKSWCIKALALSPLLLLSPPSLLSFSFVIPQCSLLFPADFMQHQAAVMLISVEHLSAQLSSWCQTLSFGSPATIMIILCVQKFTPLSYSMFRALLLTYLHQCNAIHLFFVTECLWSVSYSFCCVKECVFVTFLGRHFVSMYLCLPRHMHFLECVSVSVCQQASCIWTLAGVVESTVSKAAQVSRDAALFMFHSKD